MDRFYGAGQQGLALSGMDDAGEMSAWYVFNAMGFYPFSPASANFLVSVPLFDTIDVKTGSLDFHIIKENNGPKIEKLKVDGTPLNKFNLSYQQIQNGDTLHIYNTKGLSPKNSFGEILPHRSFQGVPSGEQ